MKDIKPALRRAVLAAHECNRKSQLCEESTTVTETDVSTTSKSRSLSSIGNTDSDSIVAVHPLSHKSLIKPTKRKSRNSTNANLFATTAIFARRASGIPARLSCIYSKFMNHFQHLYNGHDALNIVTSLLQSRCVPDAERLKCLWASPTGFYKNVNACGQVCFDSNLLLATQTTNGMHAVQASYEQIFHKLPDLLLIYDAAFTKETLLNGHTVITVPSTVFFTVPRLPVFAGNKEIIFRDVRVEMHSFSIWIFDEYGVIRGAQDHHVELLIDDPQVSPFFVLKFLGFA
jgi:hypothetical protein